MTDEQKVQLAGEALTRWLRDEFTDLQFASAISIILSPGKTSTFTEVAKEVRRWKRIERLDGPWPGGKRASTGGDPA